MPISEQQWNEFNSWYMKDATDLTLESYQEVKELREEQPDLTLEEFACIVSDLEATVFGEAVHNICWMEYNESKEERTLVMIAELTAGLQIMKMTKRMLSESNFEILGNINRNQFYKIKERWEDENPV